MLRPARHQPILQNVPISHIQRVILLIRQRHRSHHLHSSRSLAQPSVLLVAVLLRLVLSQRLTRSPTANHFTRPRQLRVLSSQQTPCELKVWLGLHRSTETYSLLFPDQCRERPTTRTTYNSTTESAEFDTCLTVCAQWCTETTVPGRNGVFL